MPTQEETPPFKAEIRKKSSKRQCTIFCRHQRPQGEFMIKPTCRLINPCKPDYRATSEKHSKKCRKENKVQSLETFSGSHQMV